MSGQSSKKGVDEPDSNEWTGWRSASAPLSIVSQRIWSDDRRVSQHRTMKESREEDRQHRHGLDVVDIESRLPVEFSRAKRECDRRTRS